MNETSSEKAARENLEDWTPLLHLHQARDRIAVMERQRTEMMADIADLETAIQRLREALKDREDES